MRVYNIIVTQLLSINVVVFTYRDLDLSFLMILDLVSTTLQTEGHRTCKPPTRLVKEKASQPWNLYITGVGFI